MKPILTLAYLVCAAAPAFAVPQPGPGVRVDTPGPTTVRATLDMGSLGGHDLLQRDLTYASPAIQDACRGTCPTLEDSPLDNWGAVVVNGTTRYFAFRNGGLPQRLMIPADAELQNVGDGAARHLMARVGTEAAPTEIRRYQPSGAMGRAVFNYTTGSSPQINGVTIDGSALAVTDLGHSAFPGLGQGVAGTRVRVGEQEKTLGEALGGFLQETTGEGQQRRPRNNFVIVSVNDGVATVRLWRRDLDRERMPQRHEPVGLLRFTLAASGATLREGSNLIGVGWQLVPAS